MSRVLLNRVFAKDNFKVASSVVSLGWKSGQVFQLDSLSQAVLAVTDGSLFVGVDSPTELASPPTGSLLTGVYGIGTKLYILYHTPGICNINSITHIKQQINAMRCDNKTVR